MNKILIFFYIISLISCDKNNVKKTVVKQKKTNIESLFPKTSERNFDSIVKSNFNNFVFMNFYPTIEDKVFNNLAEKYVSKGKLKKKDGKYYYTINNYDYIIGHKYPYYILLSKKVRHTTSKKVYKKNITDLINVFKRKYKNMKIKKGKNSVPFWESSLWTSSIWETYTFKTKNKIIKITGHQTNNLTNYQKSEKENRKNFNNFNNYIIFIEFYTPKSFQNKKNKIEIYENYKQKKKRENSKKDSIRKLKRHNELMNDI